MPVAVSSHDLLENHLAFLAAHRGTVERGAGMRVIRSALPGFTSAIVDATTPADATPWEYETVHVLDGVGRWRDALLDRGCVRRKDVVYMTLVEDRAAIPSDPRFRVTDVADESGMDVFSEVQARGFVPEPDEYPQWHAWLREANHRNLRSASQHFLVAWDAERPVGVTLLLRHGKTAGIYAVATLSEVRRQGVATTLLAHAVRRAPEAAITLQVLSGTPAESLYRSLGFAESFRAEVYGRE